MFPNVHAAIDGLYRSDWGRIVAALIRQVGDFDVAEEAAQEAFIVAWTGLSRVRQPEAFPGWLRRLVVTQCHRRLRCARLPLLPYDDTLEIAAPIDTAVDANPAHAATIVRLALGRLSSADRLVLVLFYGSERTHAEIADWLCVPVTTVARQERAFYDRYWRVTPLRRVEARLEVPGIDLRGLRVLICSCGSGEEIIDSPDSKVQRGAPSRADRACSTPASSPKNTISRSTHGDDLIASRAAYFQRSLPLVRSMLFERLRPQRSPRKQSTASKPPLEAAVESGLILVAAAGNQWPFVVYPARYDDVIACAACNGFGHLLELDPARIGRRAIGRTKQPEALGMIGRQLRGETRVGGARGHGRLLRPSRYRTEPRGRPGSPGGR